MGKMKDLLLEQHEVLYAQYEEDQRNELRSEGATEVCKMIHYDLTKKYESALIFAKPSEPRPMALREAIKIVEAYLQ